MDFQYLVDTSKKVVRDTVISIGLVSALVGGFMTLNTGTWKPWEWKEVMQTRAEESRREYFNSFEEDVIEEHSFPDSIYIQKNSLDKRA